MRRLELTRPDDWHLHLRDGAAMADVVGFTARQFGRAIIMPNLKPPVVDTAGAEAYRQRILAALPPGSSFDPLMTLYLTDNTKPDEASRARGSGIVHGFKLYPAGATTNSDSGVTDIEKMDPVFAAMATAGMPLLLHGEVTTDSVDIFDRESVFVEEVLTGLVSRHPDLKIVLEHITTARAATFVAAGPPTLAATITAHHLLDNRNDMLVGGIRPHLYCLPILKRESDRQALLAAAISGSPKFFLGTDSAPHAIEAKEAECGCAGAFTAHAALELYAEAFDSVNALDAFAGFASHYGPDFYGLPRNSERIALVEEGQTLAREFNFGESAIRPYRAGERIRWRLEASA
jgi:dihydroorotase